MFGDMEANLARFTFLSPFQLSVAGRPRVVGRAYDDKNKYIELLCRAGCQVPWLACPYNTAQVKTRYRRAGANCQGDSSKTWS